MVGDAVTAIPGEYWAHTPGPTAAPLRWRNWGASDLVRWTFTTTRTRRRRYHFGISASLDA